MAKPSEKAERMELRRSIGQRPQRPLPPPMHRGTPYRVAHVCFACRRSTKRTPTTSARPCVRCRGPVYEMGRSFRAPVADDIEQWLEVQTLYAHGFRFLGARRAKDAPLPERLRDVEHFLREHPEHPLCVAPPRPELLPVDAKSLDGSRDKRG